MFFRVSLVICLIGLGQIVSADDNADLKNFFENSNFYKNLDSSQQQQLDQILSQGTDPDQTGVNLEQWASEQPTETQLSLIQLVQQTKQVVQASGSSSGYGGYSGSGYGGYSGSGYGGYDSAGYGGYSGAGNGGYPSSYGQYYSRAKRYIKI